MKSNNKIDIKLLIERLSKVIVLTILILIMLVMLTNVFERKDSKNKYKAFFSQKENFDVLFIGASHVINGVFPMDLWNNNGIVSYNMGGHSNAMATSYWVLENALEYTDPKLVVIDCMNSEGIEKTSKSISYVHLSLDAFPPSVTKYKAIKDLLNDDIINERIVNGEVDDYGEKRSTLGLLWDYSVYHSRWKELTKEDFKPEPQYEKGAESRIKVSIPSDFNKVNESDKWGNTISMDYLRNAIKSCQDKGIDVLLIYLPFPANEIQQMTANSIQDIADEMGVNYINFLNSDIVDFTTDCYDENSHLNPSGARKVTKYLGEYIASNYDIPDQRINSKYESWNTDYQMYRAYMLNVLKEQDRLDNYLMLLADKEYAISIEIASEAFDTISPYKELINNTIINTNADIYNVQNKEYDIHITVKDASSTYVYDDSYWYCELSDDGNSIIDTRVERY